MPAPLDFPASPLLGSTWPAPPVPNQPVYTFDGTKWTTLGLILGGPGVVVPSTATPLPDADPGSAGAANEWSRGDHVHPMPDLSIYAPINNPIFTGDPQLEASPVTGDSDTSIATTGFVKSAIAAVGVAGMSVLVSETPPVGAPDNTLWFNSSTGRIYIFYNDGTGPSQWIAAAPVPDQLTSRAGVYAAPYDAMAYSGLQINGGFEVDQPNAGASVAVAAGTVNSHLMDGWRAVKTGTSAFSVQQTASVFAGYTKELKLTVTTAQASIGSDTIDIRQYVEGYRVAKLALGTASAQPFVIAFWFKSSVAGNFTVLASNSTLTVNATATVPVSVAGVAQFVTATFPAQTSGTWLADSNTGIIISVRVAGSSGINIAATNGNTFEMTGVTFLPGTQYPIAAQSTNVMRSFDQELVTCKRYYQKLSSVIVDTSAASHSTIFPVEMRIAPVVTGGGAGFAASNSNTVSAQFSQTTRAAQTLLLDARL